MVVTTTSGARSAYAEEALGDLIKSQDDLDEMGEKLSKTMAELHALQDVFEKAVKKQARKLLGVKLTSQSKKRRAESQSASSDASTTASTVKGTDSNDTTSAEANGNAANGPSSLSAESKSAGAQRSSEDLGKAEASSNEAGSSKEVANSRNDNEIHEQIQILSERLRNNEQLMPATGGVFVEMFLGSLNVRFTRKSEALSFKHEYEKLKLKLAPIFVVTCIACLFYEDYRWLHMILQLALSCYYVTLAVRENILRRNGSNIRTWWISHHYFTMTQGVLLLTWPNGESYGRYRRILHMYGLYNAVLMIFQTRYQMARLYTLRSLGMAHEMDVASSDSPQIHWSETMKLLLPLILLGQLMQAFQAVFLGLLYRDFRSELQILLLCLLFAANFVGNSITTFQVLQKKREERRRRPDELQRSDDGKKTR